MLQLLVYKERDGVVVLSKNLVLSICVLLEDTWTTATETKLSTSVLGTQDRKSDNTMACWIGPHIIAVASDHDEDLRCFNLQTEASALVSAFSLFCFRFPWHSQADKQASFGL